MTRDGRTLWIATTHPHGSRSSISSWNCSACGVARRRPFSLAIMMVHLRRPSVFRISVWFSILSSHLIRRSPAGSGCINSSRTGDSVVVQVDEPALDGEPGKQAARRANVEIELALVPGAASAGLELDDRDASRPGGGRGSRCCRERRPAAGRRRRRPAAASRSENGSSYSHAASSRSARHVGPARGAGGTPRPRRPRRPRCPTPTASSRPASERAGPLGQPARRRDRAMPWLAWNRRWTTVPTRARIEAGRLAGASRRRSPASPAPSDHRVDGGGHVPVADRVGQRLDIDRRPSAGGAPLLVAVGARGAAPAASGRGDAEERDASALGAPLHRSRRRPPPATNASLSDAGSTSPRLPGVGLEAPLLEHGGQVEPLARARDRHVQQPLRLLAVALAHALRRPPAGCRRPRPAGARPGRRGRSRSDRRGRRCPGSRFVTNTIGNSSPLAACTVIRLTESSASTTAFDSSPADSRSRWSATRAIVA